MIFVIVFCGVVDGVGLPLGADVNCLFLADEEI